MNQILEYDTNRKSSGNSGSDKVVKIFAIILVLFAVILICIVIKDRKSNDDEAGVEQYSKADINVDIDEESSKAIISVTADEVIEKLVYSWENGKENVISGDSKTMSETIDVPSGDNVLHIKVVDVNGSETTFSQDTHLEQGIDIKNPEINLEVTDDAKLKITATDETELSFVTYRWNDETEEQVDVGDDKKKIEIEIDILKGENDLTIIAVDSSNNTTTERKSFTGRTKPTISVVLSADGSSVTINANDEYGIETIKLNFNGQDYDVTLDSEAPLSASFGLGLENGNNRIIVTVTSIYGISTTFDGECTYGNNPEEQEVDVENNNEEATEENNENLESEA